MARDGAPAEVQPSINNEVILDSASIYGGKDVGYPVDYERLRLVLTSDVVRIEAFDHGTTLFMTENEKVKRIRRVPCKLDERKE